MFDFLPKRKSKGWLIIFFIYAALLFLYFLLARNLVQDRQTDRAFVSAAALVSVIIALVVSIFGYMNARVVFTISTAGVAAGMVMMLVTLRDKTGWEDLIGPVLFLELTLLGFAAGVLLEVMYFILRVTKDKKKKKRE